MSKWTDEEALTYLREQFGEGWECLIETAATGGYVAAARSSNDRVDVDAYGPDPMSAARACVEAWREATKAEHIEAINAELRQQATASRENASNLAVQLGDARKQVDVLKAEVKAWREWEPEGDMGPIAEPRDLDGLRAATDALFKEGM